LRQKRTKGASLAHTPTPPQNPLPSSPQPLCVNTSHNTFHATRSTEGCRQLFSAPRPTLSAPCHRLECRQEQGDDKKPVPSLDVDRLQSPETPRIQQIPLLHSPESGSRGRQIRNPKSEFANGEGGDNCFQETQGGLPQSKIQNRQSPIRRGVYPNRKSASDPASKLTSNPIWDTMHLLMERPGPLLRRHLCRSPARRARRYRYRSGPGRRPRWSSG
jgi:hypothetical protein